jgi:predicted Zn-dependent peptidase
MEEQEILKYVQLYIQSLPAFETPNPKPKTKKQSKKDLLLLEQHTQIK